MRNNSGLVLLLACAIAGTASVVDAQDPPRSRAMAELAIGAGTRVPHWGDEGLGPFVSAMLRVPIGSSDVTYLAGLGYGIVFTEGWTSPDGVQYDFAPEAGMLHVGLEWPLNERGTWAFDGQWNPAVSRVRRWGEQPPWRPGSSEWVTTLSTMSLGMRWTVPTQRGPVVGLGLRAFVSVHPGVLFSYGLNAWPAVSVTIRPR